MDNFDPYTMYFWLLLQIYPGQRLKTGFVVQGHIRV